MKKIKDIAEVLERHFPKDYMTEEELIAAWRYYHSQREYSANFLSPHEVSDSHLEGLTKADFRI